MLAMLGGLEIGRRLRFRELADGSDAASGGTGTVEGAVFALLGLLIAFTFTGASGRFDMRRQQIIEETNAIGTAWLRIDMLSSIDQPPLRDAFRRYTDARIRVYSSIPDMAAVEATLKEAGTLQRELWTLAVAAVNRDSRPQAATLLLPAINDMFDIATSRSAAARMHVPALILWLLCGLAVLASILAGYSMATPEGRSWLHLLMFATIISLTVYVILDLEFPRIGLMRIDAMDRLMVDLRASMG